jgi:streptomycin 6-kinase
MRCELWAMSKYSMRLRLERQRVVGYALAQAVLSACWSIEAGESGWEGLIRVAEELTNF